MLKQIEEKTAEMLSDMSDMIFEQKYIESRERLIKFSGESLKITFL